MAGSALILHPIIREQWASYLVQVGKFDSPVEVMEADYCFACGMKSGERTAGRIIDPSKPGTPDNVHLLCGVCEESSRGADDYWAWFRSRNSWSTISREH